MLRPPPASVARTPRSAERVESMKAHLTDRSVKGLLPNQKNIIVYDEEVVGFGVRITSGGPRGLLVGHRRPGRGQAPEARNRPGPLSDGRTGPARSIKSSGSCCAAMRALRDTRKRTASCSDQPHTRRPSPERYAKLPQTQNERTIAPKMTTPPRGTNPTTRRHAPEGTK